MSGSWASPIAWAAVIGNVTIVEQPDGVVLIDSGGTVADGRDVVEAVSKLTTKPIKAVAITHWHNDHPFGAPAVLDRYPKTRIIGTKATGDYIASETGTGVGKADKARNEARYVRAQNTLNDLRKEMADPKVPEDMRAQYAIEMPGSRRGPRASSKIMPFFLRRPSPSGWSSMIRRHLWN